MKIVDLVFQVFFLLVIFLVLIYFLTAYDSALKPISFVTLLYQVTITNLEIMVVIMILRHISGYFTRQMKIINQPRLLRNLGTNFYNSNFL